jgi:hypothetical protein
LTGHINYTAPPTGSNLTLQVAKVGGATDLQLFDNTLKTVVQQVALNQDIQVQITGAPKASNLLTVDFSYAGGGTPEPISVLFDGGTPAKKITDEVTIGGSGAQYQPASFTLQSNDDTFVTGVLHAVGDISLTASQQSNGAVTLPGTITANAAANITVNGGSLTGHNITLAARSTINVNSQNANLFNGLIQAGVVSSSSGANVQVQSGNLTASGNLSLTAKSDVTTALATAPTAPGATKDDAAVSTSTIASTASVVVSGGILLATGGQATLAATNTVDVTTTADGSAGGFSKSAKGGTVAVTVLSGDTDATISGGKVTASGVSVSATGNRTVTTLARATQGGAAPGSPNPNQGQQTLTNNGAKTPDGSVNVAGAVAVTNLTGDTNARVIGGSVTSSTAPLTITASAANHPTTTADGSPASGASGTGVGVAVAIGRTTANSLASLGGTTNVTAPAVNISSVMPATVSGVTPASQFRVAATSGPSGAVVGVAGALAIDVTSVQADALVESGSNVNVHGADLTLSAQSTTSSPASALPQQIAGQSVGVGASVAINVPGAGARAAVEKNATLAGAHALTLSALGNHAATTSSLAGAAGGTATAGALSLAIPSGATEAAIGSGPTLTLGGGLTVTANRTTVITTQVDSASAASGVAVGASVGLTIANESAAASVGRNVNTGAAPALIQAEGNGSSNTTALASVSGAKPGSTAVNTLLGNVASFAKGQGWTPGTVTIPTAATPDGQVGVAGAIAVNLASLDASAQLLPSSSLQVAGGTLTVETSTTYSDSAVADGTAVNTATGVAGAVAINRSTPTAEAIIAGSATATAVTVTATVSGQTGVTADSGQGSTNVGVAGALALNLPAATSHAAIAAGGSVLLKGPKTGDVTVQATTTVTQDNATADGKALGFAHTGVGASVALDITGNGATAEASGTVTAPDQVTIFASGNCTATATAAAGAKGGTPVAPALALAVTHNTTLALVGSAAVISAGGTMLVRALHRGKSTSKARGDTAGTSVAVGAALGVDVGLDSDEATIAGKVTQSAALTVESDLGDNSAAQGISSAKGATSAGAGINAVIADVVNFGKSSGWLPPSVEVPKATTTNGDLAVAAAVAVNVDLTGETATIAAGGSIVTSSPLLVHTLSNVDASASADGSPTDGSLLGVGAALSINVARPSIEASIAGAATAPAIQVKTEMGSEGTYTFQATALSGTGTTTTGVAGALAINVGASQSQAAIRDGANLTIGGGDLLVNSMDVTADLSNALAKSANPLVGFGASVATNAALNESHAFLGAATITGESTITIEADGTHQVTTKSNSGAQVPATAAAAAVSVAFAGDQTVAEVLAGPTTLVVPGLLDIHANGQATIATTADGKSVGAYAGVGAAVAVGVDREIVTARLARNTNVPAIELQADAQSPTTTTASAGSQGGKSLGQAIGEFVNTVIALVDPKAGGPGQVKLPPIVATLTAIQNKLGVPIPSLSLAAAVGVSAVLPQTLAEVGANAALTSATAVTVQTNVTANPITTADGSATGSTVAADLALAANYAGGNDQVAVDNGASIMAPAITLNAGGPGPQALTAKAFAGEGLVASAAAAVALNAGDPAAPNTVQVTVGNGAHLTATKGDVSLSATSDVTATTLAGGAALGLVAGVGVSIAGAFLQEQANVAVAGQVDAPAGNVFLTATGHDTLEGAAVAGNVGIVTGNAAVRADVLGQTVQAHIDPGANVHAYKDVAINASAHDEPQALEAALGLSAATVAAAATGVALTDHTWAFINGGTVRADGNVVLTADSTSSYHPLAATGSLGLIGSVAASGTLYYKSADTQAYITGGAQVDALALRAADTVLTGTETGGVPDTRSIRGVSLTATNFDDFQPLAGAVGGGLIAAAAGSGIATILNDHVVADITGAAKVDQNDAGAASSQLVNLLAWDDTHVVGVQGDVGLALIAGVSATFDFVFLAKDTEAYIGDGAVVSSNSNVEIRANSTEDLGSFTGTFNLGDLASAAAAGILHIVQAQTLAHTDAGAQINAPGSVLVLANSSSTDNIVAVVGSSAAISGQAMYSQTDIGGATFAPITIGTETIGGTPGLTSAAVDSQVTTGTLNVTATSTSRATAETVLVGAGTLTASAARPTARTSLQTEASLGSAANIHVATLVGPHASSVNTASAFNLQISAGAITGTALAPDAEAGGPAFDLQLLSNLNKVSDLPTSGTDLIIVAPVQNVLHFRVFDSDGRMVVDTDETKLPNQAGPIAELKQLLQNLWPPHQLTEAEKDQVITAVTSILGNLCGATRAFVAEGAQVTVTASGLNVQADATNTATATPVEITAGTISGSYAIPQASTAEDVEAYIGPAFNQGPNLALSGSINVGQGTVTVNAESLDNQATVNEISIKAGGLTLAYMHPQATIAGSTRGHIGGKFAITAGAVDVTGSSTNVATTNVISIDAGALTASLNTQGAKTSHTTEAYVGTQADLNLTGGALALHATSSNTATAGEVDIQAGYGNVAYAKSEAEAGGATRAYVQEGASIQATGLSVLADATNTATANRFATTLGLINVEIAQPTAQTTHDVEAYLGPARGQAPNGALTGTINVGGATIPVHATSTSNQATAQQININFGAVSVSVEQPRVTVAGSTSAHIGGNFRITAGSVDVLASAPNNTATGNAISIAAAGANVAVDDRAATTNHTTEAYAGANSGLTITGGSLSLHATSTNTAESGQAAITVAAVNIAVAKSEANAGGSTSAYVQEGASITAQGLDLSAQSDNTAEANPVDFGVAAVKVAVVHPIADTTHTTEVYIGPAGNAAPTPSSSGQINVASGTVTGTATSTNKATVDALDIGVSGVDVSVLHPEVTAGGSTQSHLGGKFAITAGTLKFTANSTSTATSNSVSIELSGVNVTDSIKSAESNHDTRAFVDTQANLTISGTGLTLDAESSNTATAGEVAVHIAGVPISLIQPAAHADGTTRAYVDEGIQLQAGGLSATATGTNTATVSVDMVLVGLVPVTLIQPTATTGDDTQAYIGPEAGAPPANLSGNISVSGAVTLGATSHDTAHVQATNISFGAVNVTSVRPNITAGGNTLAHLGGNYTINAPLVTVTATASDTQATTQTFSLDIGAVNVSPASLPVTAQHETEAFLAPSANVTVSGGPLTFHATGGNSATANSQDVSIGLVNVTSLSANTEVAGATQAYAGNEAVLKAGDVSWIADATTSAGATQGSFGLSLFNSVNLDPQATDQHDVEAYLAGGSDVTSTGTITISATSTNNASASSNGSQGTLIGLADVKPDAIAEGDTTAHVDGKVQTVNLAVTATASRNAQSSASVVSIQVLGGKDSANADAEDHGNTLADLGSTAQLTAKGNATFQATSLPTTNVTATGGGGGIINGSYLSSSSTIDGNTDAFADNNSTVVQAGQLEFEASVTATGSSTTNVGNGGAFADGGAVATANVNPVIQAYVGNNVQVQHVTGDIVIHAHSVRAEGDASAQVDGGGLADNGASNATVNSNPTVRAFIGTGSQVNADGNVTVSADSEAQPSGSSLGDTFNPATAVNLTNDTITFPSHGLVTGDVVTYDSNGSTPIGTPSGPLRNGEFGSIVLDANTLQLGATFPGAPANTGDLFNPQPGVDLNGDVIRFASPHEFETGDAVKYDANGHTFISSSINQTNTYYVRKLDDSTIELFQNLADAEAPDQSFDPSTAVSGNTITLPGHGFTNGEAVTYTSPAPEAFSSGAVDVNVGNNNQISGDNHGANNIYLGTNDGHNNILPHDFVTGERVIYHVEPGKTAIGGLTDGGTYWIIKTSDYTVQLASSYANALSSKAIALTPDKSQAGEAVTHYLVPAPIGGLTDGQIYYVRNATANTFQLSATPGGPILSLNVDSPADIKGQHSFHQAGIQFNNASSGSQDLYINFTSNPAGNDELLGPGGVSLRTISPPAGNGISASSADGGEGGGVVSGNPTAQTNVTATVAAYVAAQQLTAAGNVSITTNSTANTSAQSTNGGGGLVFGGDASASTSFQNNNSAFVGVATASGIDGTGVQIVAGGNFQMTADSSLQNTFVSSSSNGGGLVSRVNATSTANLGGTTQSVVGKNASVKAQTVAILADYTSAQGTDNSSATAGGLFGSATANTNGTWNPSVLAQIVPGGTNTALTGTEGVDIRALTQNINVQQNPNGTFYGIGSGNSNSNVSTNLSTKVEAGSGATVTAGPRILPGPGVPASYVTPLQKPSGYPLLALYVDASSTTGGDRRIDWDSNVIILSGPSPDLLIDANGNIVRAINVSVNGGQKTGTVSGPITVDPIINNDRGQALFQADHSGSSVVSTSLPTGPLFTFRETFQTVSLVNQSPWSLIVKDINVVDETPLVPGNQVTLDANNVAGFQFSVNHDFKPTTITVQDTGTGLTFNPSIIFAGTVNNPIGITQISNAHGNIYSSLFGIVRTDGFAIAAPGGNIGENVDLPLRLQVVESDGGPAPTPHRFRTADAGIDVFMDIQALYRKGPPGNIPPNGFVCHIDRIKAGHGIRLVLEYPLIQTVVTPFDYKVQVFETGAVSSPDSPNPMIVTDHFRPGTPGSTPTLFPTDVFGTDLIGVAAPVVYEFGDASDPSTGLIAGGTIFVGGGLDSQKSVRGYAHLGGTLTLLVNGTLTLR